MSSDKKQQEFRLIEQVRSVSRVIPDGVLCLDEEPDAILHRDGIRLGIEITQIHEPRRAGEFPRREVESFHQDVIRRAEEMYRASGEPAVDVLVYFGDAQLRDVNKTAVALVNFVRSHPPHDGCETFAQGAYAAFSVVRIFMPRGGETPRWCGLESGSAPILTKAFLADVIGSKNRRLSDYRRKADDVWLLIASPMFPFASSFAVPRGVEDWRFNFDFDKVLFYSWESGIIELQRAIPSSQCTCDR